MSEDQSADDRAARAKFELSLQQMEAMAAELVHAGHALFKDGELTILPCADALMSSQ